MVDVEDLTSVTKDRVLGVLTQFPSALTRSKDSNLSLLLSGIFTEYESFRSQCDLYTEIQDVVGLVSKYPTSNTYQVDLLSSALSTPRITEDLIPESNAPYRTHLVTARHKRLSDGSTGDIADYIHSLTGLMHPSVGMLPVRDAAGQIIAIHKPYNKEEFQIHERWKFDTDIPLVCPEFTDDDFYRHCFWIEFKSSPLYPMDLEAALEGVRSLKPAGVCFKGFIFNTDKIKTVGYTTVSPTLKVDCTRDTPVTVGAVTRIPTYSNDSYWDGSDWGTPTHWGGYINNPANNTTVTYLLDAGIEQGMSALVDTPEVISYYTTELIPITESNEGSGETIAHIQGFRCSQSSGGVFCTYSGYNHGGYGSDHIWNFYEQTYFETCWRDVVIETGFSYGRKPYTQPEVDAMSTLERTRRLNLDPKNWISGSGKYASTKWGSPKWGSSDWDKDFSTLERENECIIMITMDLFCPTLYLNVDYPAVYIRCPKDTNLRDQKQIETDCVYVADDTITLFEGYGVSTNPDKPAGVSAESECTLFPIEDMPDIVLG